MNMLTTVLVLLFFLVIASFIHHIARHFRLPYTILLFIVGALLVPIDQFFGLSLVSHLTLTPELLFFVFLPVLIFDGGYHIRYQDLSSNYVTIWTLAILGLMISTLVIGFGGHWLLGMVGYDVPLRVMLLFGVIISSTDPVAVMAIFKNLGVPKRLGLIFEGESLFNDGISVAVFLIFLELFQSGVFDMSYIWKGLLSFVMMVVGGIVLGTAMGIGFSQLIKYIRNNEHVEIALTMILAHIVFITAEYVTSHVVLGGLDIQISGVIATAYAAVIMGNYGKTKISPKVEVSMEKFRSFFAFVTNSLVFLMMGTVIDSIDTSFSQLWLPICIGILVVLVARALSVYLPIGFLNISKLHNNIPRKRQHLMAWGSLRGALGLVLVLMIPNDFAMSGWESEMSIKTFLLGMTIGAIMFSLIVQGLTINPLIKRMNLSKLVDLEEYEKIESEILVYHALLKQIKRMDGFIASDQDIEKLCEKYQEKIDEAILKMQIFLSHIDDPESLIHKALSLHALGTEKQILKEMFEYNMIPEYIYYERVEKIIKQMSRVQSGNSQIRGFKMSTNIKPSKRDPIQRLLYRLRKTSCSQHDEFVSARTRYIVTTTVLRELERLKKIPYGHSAHYFDQIIDLYKKFQANALAEYEGDISEISTEINTCLINKSLMKTEEELITDLYKKEMISEKVYHRFLDDMEKEIRREY